MLMSAKQCLRIGRNKNDLLNNAFYEIYNAKNTKID